jgi:hypothetical protein
LVKEQLVNSRIGWGQPPTGWGLPQQTGWTPLVDPGPRPLHVARSAGRWLWPTLAVSGFLAVTGFVLSNDNPAPGLSGRSVLTVALAAAVVVLLSLHRRYGPGPLARALCEYAVVFGLAVLVATTGVPLDEPAAPTTPTSAVPDQRPALVKTIDSFGDWLSEWRAWARTQRDRRSHPEPNGEAMAAALPFPSSSASSTWRFGS